MLRTRCYFDMLDNCVAYDLGDLSVTSNGQIQLVDSGLYEFAEGYNPLGKSATDLWMYSAFMAG